MSTGEPARVHSFCLPGCAAASCPSHCRRLLPQPPPPPRLPCRPCASLSAAACPNRPSRCRLPHPPPPPRLSYRPRAAPTGRPATAPPLPDPAAAAIASRPTPPPSASSTTAHCPDRLSEHRHSPQVRHRLWSPPRVPSPAPTASRAPLPPCRWGIHP
jgi:hypothetical protein